MKFSVLVIVAIVMAVLSGCMDVQQKVNGTEGYDTGSTPVFINSEFVKLSREMGADPVASAIMLKI